MSLNIAIGSSDGKDPHTVGANACQDAFRKMRPQSPLFALVFISSSYDQEKAIKGIKSVAKDTPLLGTSSIGEMTHGSVLERDSIIVVLLGGEGMFFASYLQDLSPSSSPGVLGKNAGESIIREMGTKPDLSFLFTDVLSGVEQHSIVAGLMDVTDAPIFGGGAADAFEFQKTFQYFKGKAVSKSAVFASIKGDFEYGLGMAHGMLPVGMPRVVTDSSGVSIKKINDKPAVSLYGEYFGYKDLQHFTAEPIGGLSLSYPLGFRWKIGEKKINVRAPLYLKSDGSLTCSDHIPKGSYVQIMISDKDECLCSVRQAVERAKKMLGEKKKARLALVVSGAGRQYSYGSNINEEVKEVEKCLDNKVPAVGFYSYGGISATPDHNEEQYSFFQDNSISVCLLR